MIRYDINFDAIRMHDVGGICSVPIGFGRVV
jgi:hypothetical protein